MKSDTICRSCGNQFHHSKARWVLQGTGAGSEIDVCPNCESSDLTNLIHYPDGVMEIIEPELQNEFIR